MLCCECRPFWGVVINISLVFSAFRFAYNKQKNANSTVSFLQLSIESDLLGKLWCHRHTNQWKLSVISGRSFINTKNNKGPKIEPWCTPHSSSAVDDSS